MIQVAHEMLNAYGSGGPYMEGNGNLSLFSNEINQSEATCDVVITQISNNTIQMRGGAHQKIFPGYYS